MLKDDLGSMEINRDNVILDREIGQGEFGLVMHALASHLPGENSGEILSVAVKVMRERQSASSSNAFIREALRMKDLRHKNVIQLLGVCFTSEPFLIVLEYMSNGDLKSLLRQCKNTNELLTQKQLMKLSMDISSGFSYLQAKRFVHRDIAARNVLVSGNYVAKIGDFGMAKRIYNAEYYTQSSETEGSLVLPIRSAFRSFYFVLLVFYYRSRKLNA
jgi:serine/threonine protein kinase